MTLCSLPVLKRCSLKVGGIIEPCLIPATMTLNRMWLLIEPTGQIQVVFRKRLTNTHSASTSDLNLNLGGTSRVWLHPP